MTQPGQRPEPRFRPECRSERFRIATDGAPRRACQFARQFAHGLDDSIPEIIERDVGRRDGNQDQIQSSRQCCAAQAKCLSHEALEPVAVHGISVFFFRNTQTDAQTAALIRGRENRQMPSAHDAPRSIHSGEIGRLAQMLMFAKLHFFASFSASSVLRSAIVALRLSTFPSRSTMNIVGTMMIPNSAPRPFSGPPGSWI